MRRFSLLCLPLLLCTVFPTGCASTSGDRQEEVPAPEPDSKPEDQARKLEDAEQALALGVARLEVAELQLESSAASAVVRLEKARAEVQLAQAELAKFTNADLPARVAKGELDLRTTRDRVQEAADELAQIELMYADQDLNDKTAEFVVSRGRRQAERAMARLGIQETEFKTLTEAELPLKRRRLELALAATQTALAAAERDVQIEARQKAIALREARHKVKSLELDLAEAREEQQ